MKAHPAPPTVGGDVAAYAACAWSLAFAAVHLYWAIGGTALLPPGMSVGMNPALFVIDVVAIPLCVAGSLLALALARPWGRAFPRRLLLACGWGTCTLLIVHLAPTLIEGGLVAAGLLDVELSMLERWSLFVYEPWFFAGGLLYGLSAWRYGRRSRAVVVAESGIRRPPDRHGEVAGADRDRRRGGHRR
jgi:hypothetical protein